MTPETVKMTYDLFANQYTNTLTIIGILITVFCGVIPITLYISQKCDLSKERKNIQDEIANKISDLLELKKEAQLHEAAIRELRELQNNAYIVLTQFYIDKASDILKHYRQSLDKKEFKGLLSVWDNMLKCLINANDKQNLTIHMNLIQKAVSDLRAVDKTCFDSVVKSPSNHHLLEAYFILKGNLAEFLGEDNDVYKKFINAFSFIYDYEND